MIKGMFSHSSILGMVVDVCALLCIYMLWDSENTALTVAFVVWGLVVAVDFILAVYRLVFKRS